jgi:acyl-CoA synthetase (AMP-forming)/AMP-acid ligase II
MSYRGEASSDLVVEGRVPDGPGIHRSTRPDQVLSKALTMNCADYITRDWEVFSSRVAIHDSAIGVDFTYQELDRSVWSCATGFQQRGLGNGIVLALFAANSAEWTVVFLSALRAGGCVTTLNPAYGAEEVRHQLEDARAVWVATVSPLLGVVQQAAWNSTTLKWTLVLDVQCLDVPGIQGATSLSELLRTDPADFVVPSIRPEVDLAVLPYSSGTTGLPKGVMLSHANLIANQIQMGEESTLNIAINDVIMAVLPFYHIYGMTVIQGLGLGRGAKLVSMPKFDPGEFLSLLKDHAVTVAFVAPPIVSFLAKHPLVEEFLPLPQLKEIFSGAAPLGHELAVLCKRRLGIRTLRQGYGLTETSPGTHCGTYGTSKHGSCGRLIPNVVAKIVDIDSREALGTGEENVGEIWIKGPNVMKGYLGNAQATAACIDSEGFFHTGDVGYVDGAGDFFITDRLKELIKVKGFQVAPAELEALLAGCPGVGDAAVIGIAAEREGDGQVPKAFVVRKPDGPYVTEDHIMEYVEARVVAYKCLAKVEFIDAIPKVPSGKILRKELRAREAKTFG